MIKISKSTSKAVLQFAKKEWRFANIEHYGHDVLFNEKDFVFKATENNKIVGEIKGSHEGGVVYISYLLVAHDKKRQGIGKLLTESAEKFGKELQAHKIHLITGKDWESAKFYKALGYQETAILPKHHFKQDFVVYEKFI